MRKIYFAILTIIAAFSVAAAQDSPGIIDELAPQPFWVDYTVFHKPGSDSLEVEVYYKIYSSLLPFHKWGERFKAEYVVDVIINKKGKQVTGASNEGQMVADNYEASVSKDDFIINRASFALLPDDYQLIARLSDPSSGGLVAPIKVDLKLRDFRKGLAEISGIEFARESTPVTADSQFARSGLRLIPSVSRIYGDGEPEVIIYYEIYNRPEFLGEYLAIYEVKDREKTVYTDTTIFPSDGQVTSRQERIEVNDLLPGEYLVELKVLSPGSEMEISREGGFKIGWSIIGLVKNDFKTAIEQLRYIASTDEIKNLQNASVEDRLRVWNEFWKSQDPTPTTPENELKEEYYKRLRYADLNFGHFGRDGWKTDMGKVYITHGQPDEIDRHPFDIDSKPYQVWTYYNPWRVFRFVDFTGFGEFELILPYDGDPRKFR